MFYIFRRRLVGICLKKNPQAFVKQVQLKWKDDSIFRIAPPGQNHPLALGSCDLLAF